MIPGPGTAWWSPTCGWIALSPLPRVAGFAADGYTGRKRGFEYTIPTILGLSSQVPTGNPSPVSLAFVEVEVDTETGHVQVLRAVFAHDLGRLIHPKGAEGQVEGGFQQGMGYALMENLQFDPDSCTCLTGDFLD